MNAADNPQIEALLNASARDERTLTFPVDDEIFGFHTQQAIEKLFKALISAHGEEFPFTHDLDELALQLESLGETLPKLPLSLHELSQYAVEARYGAGVPLTMHLRDELRAAVSEHRRFVDTRRVLLRQAGIQVRNP